MDVNVKGKATGNKPELVWLPFVGDESDYSAVAEEASAATVTLRPLWNGPHERDCSELLLVACSSGDSGDSVGAWVRPPQGPVPVRGPPNTILHHCMKKGPSLSDTTQIIS